MPWSRVFIEELIASQLVKELPTFYGTRRFITVPTRVCHQNLSCTSSVHTLMSFFIYICFNIVLSLSIVLCEKLTVDHLVKKFTTFYGTQRFITVFTRAYHRTLSWQIESSLHPHQLFMILFNIVLPFMVRSCNRHLYL
jgi:hypothetical protein